MTTVLLFAFAVVVCIGISRYNEDDRLFWKLLLSLCCAYALSVIWNKTTTPIDDGKVCQSSIQVQPQTSPSYTVLTDAINIADTATVGVKKGNYPQEVVQLYGNITPPVYTQSNARGQPKILYYCPYCRQKLGNRIDIQDDS